MSEKKPSMLDWLLYFGSRDERHRLAADRAGHLGFWVAFTAVTVDFVLRVRPVPGDLAATFAPVAADLVVIFLAGGIYTWLWIVQGVTLLDTSRQRRVYWVTLPLAGLGGGLLIWFQGGYGLEAPWALVASIAAGVAIALLSGLAVAGLNAWARRRAETASRSREW